MVMMIMYSLAQAVVLSVPATTVATSAANQGDMTMLLSLPKLFLAVSTIAG
jgi:hypothetical protein